MNSLSRNVLFVVAVVFIVGAIYFLESSKVDVGDFSVPSDVPYEEERNTISGPPIEQKISRYSVAPELVGIEGYINVDDINIMDLRGKVVLVDFWTYSCINCIRTFPYLTSWDEKYRDKGLVIIGVHTPEFGFEKDRDNVVDATIKHGIEYAVVQDNSYATWTAYKNRFWPRKYLIDGDGFIRYDHIGEGAYEETELKIQELLAELGEDVYDVGVTEGEGVGFGLARTPELYAGYKFGLPRGQTLGNEGGLKATEIAEYVLPDSFRGDTIYLEGRWKSNEDDLELVGDFGKIVLKFRGGEVNIVADSIDVQEMRVIINGDDLGIISIDNPDLYNVYDGKYRMDKLELEVSKGFSFNAFTFG